MIHLFHGDDIYASRSELGEIKKSRQNHEIVQLDGKRATMTDLIQATESTSLFNDSRLVIVENIFCRQFNRKSKELGAFIAWIKALPETVEIIFWEEKELSKGVINEMPKKSDIALYRPDRKLFQLVDTIKPNNTAKLLQLLNNCLNTDPIELIFALILRQMRLLIMAKDLHKNLPAVSPWQASKIQIQSALYSKDYLLQLYRQLLRIDTSIKSGTSPFDLTQCVKLFLIEL